MNICCLEGVEEPGAELLPGGTGGEEEGAGEGEVPPENLLPGCSLGGILPASQCSQVISRHISLYNIVVWTLSDMFTLREG